MTIVSLRHVSVLAAMLVAQAAFAQGVGGGAVWTAAIANSNVPSAPATDLSYNLSTPTVYVAQSTRLYAFNASSAGGGATRWMKDYTPTLVQNYPSPVPLKGGQNVIFFGGSDGRLYAVKASDGTSFWPGGPLDLRRASCTAEDKIVATPAVQLWNYSDTNFRAASSDDLVFVATRYGCSTTAANRVYAIRASTGAIAWTFNLDASFAIDYASEGCAIDYGTNLLYCGFNQPAGTTQNSLYALNTATASASGSRVWAVNAGSIRTRPSPRGSKLYVATQDGYLRARNLSNGAEAWSVRVTSSYSIVKNPWPEPRVTSQYAGWIVVIDSGGNVYAYDDSTGVGVRKWTLANYGATSMMASAPFMSRLYIGKNDGTVHELDYANSAEKSSLRVGSATSTIYDPAIANEANANGRDGDRLFVASGSQLGLFSIPWAPCTLDPDGVTWICSTGASSGTCYMPTCGVSDGCGTYCICSGVISNYVLTCGSPNSCCVSENSSKLCTDELTDSYNCGGCGMACSPGTGCQGGNCTSCSVSCGGTTPICRNNGTACICSPTSCSTLGPQNFCNTTTGACQCTPSCTFKECGADGCGGSCGSCSTLGTAAYCDSAGLCKCTPSCTGKTCGDDGCGGSCGSCGGTTPTCTAAGQCVCSGSSCAPIGSNAYCNGVSCQCTPNCTGKVCGPNGCGGSCGSCGGSTPLCTAGGACVCNNTSCTAYANSYCNGTSCACTPSCPACNDALGVDNGCGGICTKNCTGTRSFCCADGVTCGTFFLGGGDSCPP